MASNLPTTTGDHTEPAARRHTSPRRRWAAAGAAMVLPVGLLTLHGPAPAGASAKLTCDGQPVTIRAELGNTTVGTPAADVILGTLGDDIIDGRGGDDVICGLSGNDTIRGQNGNDTIFAGLGDDTALGGAGDDTILGGLGDDTVLGGDGNDALGGGLHTRPFERDLQPVDDGNNTINGGPGDDVLVAEVGDDHLIGEEGQDEFYADANLLDTGSATPTRAYGADVVDMATKDDAEDEIAYIGGGDDFVKADDGLHDTIAGNSKAGEWSDPFDPEDVKDVMTHIAICLVDVESESHEILDTIPMFWYWPQIPENGTRFGGYQCHVQFPSVSP